MVELEEKVRRMEIDIIMIQESKLRSLDKDPRIAGYSTVRKDRDVGMGGGLVTFTKEDIPFITVNHYHGLPDSKLEALIIDLNPATLHRMTCVNVYRPPSRRAHQVQDFSTSELPTAQNIIIGGDLNVHASSWDQWQPEDEMGAKLEDWMADNDFGIVNDGSATRVNAGTGGRSAPDVTMVNNFWLDKVEWSTIECMGSDHLPIIITVDCPLSTLKPPPITELRWNWAKADFEGFSRDVEVSVMSTPLHIATASLDARMRYLNESMLSAAKVNIGKVKATTNDKEWMSRENKRCNKDAQPPQKRHCGKQKGMGQCMPKGSAVDSLQQRGQMAGIHYQRQPQRKSQQNLVDYQIAERKVCIEHKERDAYAQWQELLYQQGKGRCIHDEVRSCLPIVHPQAGTPK